MWLSQVLKYLSNLEFGPRNNSDDLVHYFIAALNSTLEVGVLYRQDMSTDGLLKDGGVRLPPDVSGSPPFDPTLKATILYFSYFTEEAQYETEDHEELKAIQTYGHIVASKLLKRVYDVDVHPDSIKAYYWAAADNARAVGKWDAYAVAEIISGQVQDEQTLRKVTSFLSTLNRDHWGALTCTEKLFVHLLSKASSSDSTAYVEFVSYWLGAVRSKNRNTPLIPDPEMLSSHESVDPKTVSNYRKFLRFESSLSHRIRNNVDD